MSKEDVCLSNIDHPSHYNKGDIECIDAIKASMSLENFLGFLKGNIVKYLWRADNKGHRLEDLYKCKWYLEKLIENTNDITTSEELKF